MAKISIPCAENDYLGHHAELILSSFSRIVGKHLVDPDLPDNDRYCALFEAEFCVVSHSTEDDPVFNYGNKSALELFESKWQDFTRLPSRHSAEPQIRAERDRLLDSVAKNGFIDDYKGVRVSAKFKSPTLCLMMDLLPCSMRVTSYGFDWFWFGTYHQNR
jgi:hypothetical protein